MGGGIMGSVFGIVGSTMPYGGRLVAGIFALAVAAWIGITSRTDVQKPLVKRQVRKDPSVQKGSLVGVWRWGVALGLGVATRTGTRFSAVLLLCLISSGSALGAMSLGIGYGMARTGIPLGAQEWCDQEQGKDVDVVGCVERIGKGAELPLRIIAPLTAAYVAVL